jgi:uncharacterized protein YabE (DUF348 family)
VLLPQAEEPATAAGNRDSGEGRPPGAPRSRPLLSRLSRNHHLHFALLAALATAALITVAVPIARLPSRGGPAAEDTQAAARSSEPSPSPFTVHADGRSLTLSTRDTTVGQALAAVGIRIGRNDVVTPSPDSPLLPGADIYVTRAKPVRIIFQGQERLVYTHSATVRDLLLEFGIQPHETDRIFPALEAPVRKGMTVSYNSFRDGVEVSEEPISYVTVYQDDPDLLEGEQVLLTAGVEGLIRREYRITRLNGVETGRELVSEVTFPATDEVIAVGTRSPATPVPVLTLGGLECAAIMNVYATYYTAASAGGNVTATGTGVYRGIIAVDPSVIPLGTRMWIPGYGYGLAADTGGAITGNIIDLGYGPNDPIDWTPHYLDICIL